MTEKKSLVEETLLQMKDLENVISENAKGILQSTMKEEIGELVKESLREQSDEDDDVDTTDDAMADDDDAMADDDDAMADDDDAMADDDDAMADDVDSMSDDDLGMDEPIDLTQASDDEILKVFKGMGEEDGIIIKKDGNTIDLEDTEEDVEYKIQLGESEFDFDEEGFENLSSYGSNSDFEDSEDYSEFGGFENYSDQNSEDYFDDEYESFNEPKEDTIFEIEMDEELEEQQSSGHTGSGYTESIVYEIELDENEEFEEELEEDFDEYSFDSDYSDDSDDSESYFASNPDEIVEEGKKFKGYKQKFKYTGKPNQEGGFKVVKKKVNKTMGTGNAKSFKYKDGENAGDKLGKNRIVKKSETKEASRTLGSGRYWGRPGLPKPKSAPRRLREESEEIELNLLRQKNEEYRKALNLFRGKLNEVAVFNSNLAYATRLFTEHSTTKQEKINILRRFDSVETLKESKGLYKIVKDELSSQTTNKPSKESIQEQIERTPSSGSAVSLIESKTYENPQFMRMKDLMVKMNIKN